jgi:hypothetical protein
MPPESRIDPVPDPPAHNVNADTAGDEQVQVDAALPPDDDEE